MNFEKYIKDLGPPDIMLTIDKYYKNPDYKIDDYYIYKIERMGDCISQINCDSEFFVLSNNCIIEGEILPLISMQYSEVFVATKSEIEVLFVRYIDFADNIRKFIAQNNWNSNNWVCENGTISSDTRFLKETGSYMISGTTSINIPHYSYTITQIDSLADPIILKIGGQTVSVNKFPICMDNLMYHNVSLTGENIQCIIHYNNEKCPTEIKYDDEIAIFKNGMFGIKKL
jgi:hypothetical protein